MPEEYSIELDLTDAPPTKYQYAVGSVSPVVQTNKPESNMDYATAWAEQQIPHRVGVALATGFDKFIRSYDQKEDVSEIDPSFDSFKVWKENGHTPDEFHAIGPMKNWYEYNLYREAKSYQDEAEQRISESGGFGQTANFLSTIATDPTTWLGFGAAKMLSQGISKAVAFGVSGIAAGAAMEAEQQFADITDRRSADESLINIAAAGVIGTTLGKAIDVYAAKKAAGKLISKGKDFHEDSINYLKDAQTLEVRAQDLSAAAVKLDPENSRILGSAARFAATALKYISPKNYAQTASEAESRAIGDKFFGRNLKTIADEKGIPRRISLGEETRNIVDQSFGKIASHAEEIAGAVERGGVYDETTLKQAILLAANERVKNLTGTGADELPNIIARQYREYFGEFNAKLKELGVEGYSTLKGYAAPLLLKADLINRDIEGFAAKVAGNIEKAKSKALRDVSALEAQLERMTLEGAPEIDLADLREEIRITRDIAEEAAEYTLGRATSFAAAAASGMNDGVNLGKYTNKIIPNRFRQRVLDFNNFIDYVETDPAKLKALYAREVAPFMASQKVFGYRTPKKAIDEYLTKMGEKESAARLAGNTKLAEKIKKQSEYMKGSLAKGWDNLTGEMLIKQEAVFGSPIMNVVTAAKHFTSMTKLGAQVLASLNDMNSILLHHHLKGYGGFVHALGKLATSPEVRTIGRRNALTIGTSFEKAIHAELMNNLANDFTNAEIFGSGVTGKVAKAMQYGSSKMQVINGSTIFDTVTRRALALAQQGILKNSMQDLIAGKLDKNSATDLAFLGIGKRDAANILKQMEKHGQDVDGIFMANSDAWDNAQAKEVFERAILRDSRRTSLRPSVGDVPHVFHTPFVNLFTQFKSWSVTATQVYGLSALQRGDAKHLMGIATLIGMASMAGVLNDAARGNKIETDPEELLWNGINTSGILGVLPDYGGSWLVHNYADINSGGGKYSDYQDIEGMLFGPVGKTATETWGATGAPVVQALDPQKDINYDAWQRNLIGVLPIPFVKPYIKNELNKNKD